MRSSASGLLSYCETLGAIDTGTLGVDAVTMRGAVGASAAAPSDVVPVDSTRAATGAAVDTTTDPGIELAVTMRDEEGIAVDTTGPLAAIKELTLEAEAMPIGEARGAYIAVVPAE